MSGGSLWQSTIFRLIFGLGLFAVIVFILAGSFKFDEVVDTVADFPLSYLAILLTASFLVSVLKGARFHVLVRHAGIEINFRHSLRLFLASQAATPIPAGETIRVGLLKQETGASLGKAVSPVLGQAVYEIAAAAVIVFAASAYYPELFVPSVIAVIGLVLMVWILLYRRAFNFALRLFVTIPGVGQYAERIKSAREHLRHNFTLLQEGGFDRHVFAAIILALVAQLMGGLLVLIATTAFDLPLNFFQATLVYACGAILQGLFTLIPAGLGVTEGGMSGVLHVLGIELSVALAVVIIIRVATLLFPVVLGVILFIMFYAKQTFFGASKRRHAA
ncbi:MAG: lysylphosphatidylglycerol synthase transmembrane domain-containing protein [Patescibacteria group bacterium]